MYSGERSEKIKMGCMEMDSVQPQDQGKPGVLKKQMGGDDFDAFDLDSSSSEDSKAKAKIKDIVFDPRQRKRLLDSLNIVTTRDKWQNLNKSSAKSSAQESMYLS